MMVLDLGDYISAPYCTCLFADYGATVIKLEPPEGDTARHAGPFPQDTPNPEKSGLFLTLNTNKKGATLNVNTSDGRNILRELIANAHLLVHNYSPGYLESLDLSYSALQRINPNIVVTSITPFGLDGPYRDFQATDLVAFALTNRMSLHGMAGREPLNYAPDVVWFQVGSTAAAASVAAVFQSIATGSGRQVEISAIEAMSGNVDARTVFQQYTGRSFQRGSAGVGYPAGAYPCSDGYILFAANGERFFRRLCQAIGRPDVLTDPRWADPDTRLNHEDEFNAILLPWLLQRTKREVFTVCQDSGVMCAPVNNTEDLFEDPQLASRGYFTDVDNWLAGRIAQPGPPFKMTETPWSIRSPAPMLGQHNEEIYCNYLGYSKSDLVLLRSMGVV